VQFSSFFYNSDKQARHLHNLVVNGLTVLLVLCISSCPFDYIKVYDGYTIEAEVIGVYCGRLTDITIYSTSEALHLQFVTKSGRVTPTKKPYVPYWEKELEHDTQRQGFKAEFEISNKFVNLGMFTISYLPITELITALKMANISYVNKLNNFQN